MYPKPSSSSSDKRKSGTRDQLSDLLMNKFRSKYHINLTQERELDLAVQSEVKKALAVQQSLQEKDLNKLDSRIQDICSRFRGDANDDAKSHRSQAPSVAASTYSRARSSVRPPAEPSSAKPATRPLNMNEDEWNEVVQKNFNEFQNEQADKKNELAKQRAQMKEELLKQVDNKAQRNANAREEERQKHVEQLAQVEARLAKDELERREYNQRVQSKINAGEQFEAQNKKRFDDVVAQKQIDQEDRRKIEQSIRDANDKEAQRQAERRQYLKNLTEEDRKAKLMDKIKTNQDGSGQGDDHHINKLFDRPAHVAYDRRQKQDQVIQHINDKFNVAGNVNEKEKLRQSNEAKAGFNSQFAPELAMNAEMRRKEKTTAMRSMLAAQIELQNKEKEGLAEEKRAAAQRIAMEAADYEKEQLARRQDAIDKNKANQHAVKQQIAQRGNTLRSVGSQVIIAGKN